MAAKRIKKHVKAIRPSSPRLWTAVGTLTAYSAMGCGQIAIAQEKKPTDVGSPAPSSIQALPVRRYAIPSGTLEDVLQAFEAQARVQAKVANPGLLNVASPGVNGSYTVEQALKAILADTGITYEFESNGAITLQLKTNVTAVDVVGNAPVLEGALVKYPTPLLDTPQTINVVPQQVMQEEGVTTLRDALRNVAGISLAAGEGGSQGDNLTIRGFTARNDLYIDGIRDFGSYYRDPFNTQEVEVLQGPSSVTFGRGSTGGVVNQATKTPGLNHFMNVGLDFGTDATRRHHRSRSTRSPVGLGHCISVERDGYARRRSGPRRCRNTPRRFRAQSGVRTGQSDAPYA